MNKKLIALLLALVMVLAVVLVFSQGAAPDGYVYNPSAPPPRLEIRHFNYRDIMRSRIYELFYFVRRELIVAAHPHVTFEQMQTLAESLDGRIVGFLELVGFYLLYFPQAHGEGELLEVLDRVMASGLAAYAERNLVSVVDNETYVEQVIFQATIPFIPLVPPSPTPTPTPTPAPPMYPWVMTDIFGNDFFVPNDTEWIGMSAPVINRNPNFVGRNWNLAAINAPHAWMHWAQQTAQNGTWEINRHRHSIVRVGVIDTFFPRHDDLTFARVFGNNIPHNVSMVNYNHGIHVAGIIGADFNNGRGISGVAPNADLYVYGLHSAFLSTNVNRVHISLFGIMHSVATLFANDVNLINISMGVCNKARFQAMIAESYRANLYAFDIYAELNNALRVERDFLTVFLMRYYNLGQDFLIVQAAGNNSSREYRNHQNFIVKSLRGRVVNVGYSGLFVNIKNEEIKNRIVIVGNMRWIGNSHRTSQTGSRVDIFAPGADIISAHFNGDLVDGVVVPRILRRGRGRVVPIEPLYRPLNSTSMAAAHVAGVLAMMWGVNPYLTGAQLADLLLENTLRYIDLDYNDNVYIGAKRLISVRVDEDGWSVHNPSSPAAITHYHPILDAAAAVNAALTAAG